MRKNSKERNKKSSTRGFLQRPLPSGERTETRPSPHQTRGSLSLDLLRRNSSPPPSQRHLPAPSSHLQHLPQDQTPPRVLRSPLQLPSENQWGSGRLEERQTLSRSCLRLLTRKGSKLCRRRHGRSSCFRPRRRRARPRARTCGRPWRRRRRPASAGWLLYFFRSFFFGKSFF